MDNKDNSFYIEQVGNKYYAIRIRDGFCLAIEYKEDLCRSCAEARKDIFP